MRHKATQTNNQSINQATKQSISRLLKVGDLCPECKKGKVYRPRVPGVLVRVVGGAPNTGNSV